MSLWFLRTFVIVVILQVCGEGYQVPAGPGADQRDGWAVGALWTFLPLTHISQLHDATKEEEPGQVDDSPGETGTAL